MDCIETIKQRKSIRAFTNKVPDKALILECLDAASWAPNPTSQQPWQFIVLTGNSLNRVSRTIKESFPASPIQNTGPAAKKPEAVQKLELRKKKNFTEMISFLKESGADMSLLAQGNFNFHGAPLAVLFATWPCKDQNYVKSVLSAMQNFMLAAAAKGLGTCWANAVSICQKSIKKELDLPEDMILVDGISVGYPDPEAAVNRVPRHRRPIDEVTLWFV